MCQSYSRVEGAALLEFLVSKGADPNTKDTSGLSPLVHAKHQSANGDLIYPKIVDDLRRLGATE